MVDGRAVNGTQHAIRDVGRAGDLQKVAAGGMTVEFEHWKAFREAAL
jgi:hypothetical protein